MTRKDNILTAMLIGSFVTFLFPPGGYTQTAADSSAIKSNSFNKNKTAIMEEKDFTTSILVDQSPKEVFDAVNNVRGWWQGEVKGNTSKLNDEFTYQMGDIHFSKQKIVEVTPDKRVVWLITESKINFVAHKDEWINTKVIFDISKEGEKTKLTFTHQGLKPAIECYNGCSGAWGQLIEKSLFSLITTGKGVDVFQNK